MTKVAFLDRDGTINVDKSYVHRKEEFEFLPGVIDALKKLTTLGYKLIIITNQSGIARGYYSEEEYLELDKWLKSTLTDQGIEIMDSLYCPHLPDAVISKYRVQCNCRKPGIALFQQVIEKYNVDVQNSIAIGDRLRDVEICKSTPIEGYVLYQKIKKDADNIHFLCNGIEDVIKYLKK